MTTRGVTLGRSSMQKRPALSTSDVKRTTGKKKLLAEQERRKMVNRIMGSGLREGLWSGRDCFIIGGGKSVRDFDFNLLRGCPSIGINKAFLKFNPTIILGMDARVWTSIETCKIDADEAASAEARDRFLDYDQYGLKAWLRTGSSVYPPDIVSLPYGGQMNAWAETFEEEFGCGNNSGYVALNLAYILAPRRIYLVGYDMGDIDAKKFDPSAKQSWFHGGYPKIGQQKSSVYLKFAENIESVKDKFDRKGIEVINLSPKSRLKRYPKMEKPDHVPVSPVFVSYYTNNEPYISAAEKLKRSLRALGVDWYVERVEPIGDRWVVNKSLKTKFIERMLHKFDGRPVVWVDADATVNWYPTEFDDAKWDIAFHRRQSNGMRPNELLSGTLYFANTPVSKLIASEWAKEYDHRHHTFDQQILEKVVARWQGRANIGILPAHCCCIFDGMPEAGNDPAITHWQASRQARK